MNERKNLVVGVILGGIGGWILWKLNPFRRDDERPPIRVRGGSVVFENQPIKGEAESRCWVATDDHKGWKPEHPEGKDVSQFVVSVIRPSGQCSCMCGRIVRIMRTPHNTPPLHVKIVGNEPVVGPKNQLDPDNGIPLKTIAYHGGDLVSVAVDDEECSLNRESEVWIWPVAKSTLW